MTKELARRTASTIGALLVFRLGGHIAGRFAEQGA